jgi:DNA replication and repair protein RecF
VYVSWLAATEFRNFESIELTPAPEGLTVLLGANGAGKTSLLECIGYCSSLRSLRGASHESLLRHDAGTATLRLETMTAARPALVEIELSRHGRDRVLLNRKQVRRSEELFSALRVIVFTPEDLGIVQGGPGLRRAYLDELLITCDVRLARLVRDVERVLRQRTTVLRQAGGTMTPSIEATLEVWDRALSEHGTRLVLERERLLDELTRLVEPIMSRLIGERLSLRFSYRRSFEDSLALALAQRRREDLRRGTTSVGPHRDDVQISLDGLDVRTRHSQGRQRALAVGLRLAAREIVANATATEPVLLLDDAFSELDRTTTTALLEILPVGQALLTTASAPPPEAKPELVVTIERGTLRS